ncbi:MAG: tetratricopeptide repeat protein [Candidatus Eremiobacterota bacterium]
MEDKHPARLFEAAQRKVAVGDLESAEDLLRRAVESAEDASLYVAGLACMLGFQGRYDEALGMLKEGLEKDPANSHLLVATGTTLVARDQKGDPENAEACLRMALEIAPDHAGALYNLAILLADKGDLEEAAQLAIQAFGQAPEPELALVASSVLRLKGKRKEAFEVLEQAATYRPDDLPLVEAAVESALELQENERAATLLSQVTLEHPRIHCFRAVVFDLVGRPAQANEMLAKLPPAQELAPDMKFLLSGLYFRREEFSTSRTLVEAVLEADPMHLAAWRFRSQIDVAEGDLTGALESLGKAWELSPVPDIAASIAFLHYSMGNYEEGVELCRSVIERHPDAEEIWMFLVLFYAAMNRPDDCLGALVRTDPRSVLEVLEGASLETPAEVALYDSLREVVSAQEVAPEVRPEPAGAGSAEESTPETRPASKT